MKHRHAGAGRVSVRNSDGHAIGIDIGATGVRAAILAPGIDADGRPSVSVYGVARADLPVGAVINGIVVDRDAVAAALKRLWREHDFRCRNVILGISNQQVVVRDFTMPNLTPEMMVRALPFQAREAIALPIDDAVLDFTPFGEPEPGAETVTGLLVASPRQPVLSAVDAVERAGLRVARVDLASFAMLRSTAGDGNSVEALVDLGAHLTTIVIHDRGVPKVVRTISRGGDELTDRLVDQLDLEPAAAEQAKRTIGLTGANDAVTRVLGNSIRPLIAEIRSSIHYFATAGGSGPVERVRVTGGGAALPGLTDELTRQLDLRCEVVSPTEHTSTNRGAGPDDPAAGTEMRTTAISVGLAMGAAA